MRACAFPVCVARIRHMQTPMPAFDICKPHMRSVTECVRERTGCSYTSLGSVTSRLLKHHYAAAMLRCAGWADAREGPACQALAHVCALMAYVRRAMRTCISRMGAPLGICVSRMGRRVRRK